MTALRLPRALTWATPHLIAIALGMTYAWHVSQSAYVTTGIQFISPLLIILLAHLTILALQGQLIAGYARAALGKASASTLLLIGVIIATDVLSPAESHAAGDTFGQILGVLFCLVVLAIVLAIAAGLLYALYRILSWVWRRLSGKGDGDGDGLNDVASIGLAVTLIVAASLEGVPGAYKFAGEGHGTASYDVDAPTEAVWDAMQTATSPQFPLPDILHMFPQPVAVEVDEGTTLGANRVVLIRGREGQGKLRLRVTDQTDRKAVFQVISDSSPMARWVAFHKLTYTIHETDSGARLDVRLDYERLLAPSWIFTPMIENAAYLAMSVLANDTKIRAEQSVSTASSDPARTL